MVTEPLYVEDNLLMKNKFEEQNLCVCMCMRLVLFFASAAYLLFTVKIPVALLFIRSAVIINFYSKVFTKG